MVFLGIVVFHIFLIYGIATGLVQQAVNTVTEPFVTKIIEEEKIKDDLPPPPPPQMERPPVQVVVPDIVIPLTADAPPPPIARITTTPQITPPRPPAPGTPIRPVSMPDTSDYYPSSAKIAGEEGRPMVALCVGPNGRIESADVVESSGFPALDEAAVRVAKAGRYKPATENGQPIRACARLPVKFSLKKVKE
jgi:protein TonB